MSALRDIDLPDDLFTEANPVSGGITWPLGSGQLKRVNFRPVFIKGRLRHQFEYIQGAEAVHRNLTDAEARDELKKLLPHFKQAILHTPHADFHLTLSGRDKVRVRQNPPSRPPLMESHDRAKGYVIPEGSPNAFLARLGVMTADGRVIAAKRDKYRQINRFLEMVADVAGHLPLDREVNIVDFGCGKSYLTFALYHYLHDIRGLDVQIDGLDLKADVIGLCNTVARDLELHGLHFEVGEISGYAGEGPIDMVVSLHACDTATDDALAKAVEWGAKVILSVPCCQHELNKQLRNPLMQPMLKHGIIRERLTEIVTDSARAALLEMCGYSVQFMEFIATEHTPKNLLIRATKREQEVNRLDASKSQEYRDFAEFWGISPAMERFLTSGGRRIRGEG